MPSVRSFERLRRCPVSAVSTGSIAGILVAVFVVVVGCAAMSYYYFVHRNRSDVREAFTGDVVEEKASARPCGSDNLQTHSLELLLSNSRASTVKTAGASSLGLTATHTSTQGSIAASHAASTVSSHHGAIPRATQKTPAAAPNTFFGALPAHSAAHPRPANTTSGDTFSMTRLPDRPPPAGPNVSVSDRMEYLEYQLDISEGREVFPGIVLQPGASARIKGGQAIVQFAKDSRSNVEYAVKFFVSTRAFRDETALYKDSQNPLGKFLPQLHNIVGEGEAVQELLDARGRPLPPCIIMEKGESLDLWSDRNSDEVDIFAVMQVIHNIAVRLASLHNCGYVHRDLKQSNIMWLQRTNRWTLIDFGCAAKAGELAPLSYSLAYAAPEIIRAVQAGSSKIVADPAMDAWALGVVAVELFTNSCAVNILEGKEMVMRRITGEFPLPWEADSPQADAVLRSMGRLRNSVLGLLRRDPGERISMNTFVQRCRKIFAQTTMVTQHAREA